jgi:hypothetical protein
MKIVVHEYEETSVVVVVVVVVVSKVMFEFLLQSFQRNLSA